MSKLERMQVLFQRWLFEIKLFNIRDQSEYYSLIEQKLMEIADENGYRFVMKFDDAGLEHLFLIFQNQENLKFISAYANEEGFDEEELDHIY